MGEFGVGIGDPGDVRVVHLCREAEERVADDEACVIVGDVGELQAADDIADRKDALVCGAQAVVDIYAVGG